VTAASLLAELIRQGFRLDASDDGIGVVPASKLTDALRWAIREHKTELLVLLRRDVPPTGQVPAPKRKQRTSRKRAAVPKASVQPNGQGERLPPAPKAALPPTEFAAVPSQKPVEVPAPSGAVRLSACRRCGERVIHPNEERCWHCGGSVDVPDTIVMRVHM
jgi:hypothetical protein